MIFIFNILFFGAIAFLLFYFYMTKNFDYWKKQGIDSDDNLSIFFGSMTDAMLGRKALGETYTDLYKKFPGRKVVGYFKFRNPALLIRDPDIVRKILITDFSSFLNNDITLDPETDPIMGKNAFVQKDEEWKRTRGLITPAFTTGKIKAIYPIMREVAKDLVKYLKQHPEDIHVKQAMSRYTSEVVARCAFGIEGNNFSHSNSEMYEMGKIIWEPSFTKNLKFIIMFVLPVVNKLLRLKMVPEVVIKFFNSVLHDVIVHRQKQNIEKNDLVQYFIEIKRKTLEVAKGNIQSEILTKVYTDEDVLAGCITFFVEGYETTALTLNNVLYQLALHKDVQETLREEVDAVLSEGELTFEKLHAMSYLNSVFVETNRILPVLYNLQKLCTERYEMDIGKEKPLIIEKGTSIVIPSASIQTDPLYWEDGEKFMSERFLNKETEAQAKAKGIYMPFGNGPRMCPGSRIATTMVKLAIVEILSQMEIHPTSRTPKKIDFDPNYFMIAHKGGIFLKFIKRSQ